MEVMMKKWLSKITLSCVLFALGLSWAAQANIHLTELKNSFAGLKKEFQHLSPLHGAVGWISEYTKNIHRLDDRTKVHALAAALFHALPGGEIVAPNAPNRAPTYLTPEMIGIILGALEHERLVAEKEKEDLEVFSQSSKSNIIIEEVSSSNKRKRDPEENLPEDSSKKIKIQKSNQKTQAKKVSQVKKVSQENLLITTLTPLVLECAKKSGKKFADKNVKSDLRKLITNLFEAIKECQRVDSGYPKNTPTVLLLSFLHVISTGKQDLNAYYQGLEQQLGGVKIADESSNNNNNNIIIDEGDYSHNNITNLDYNLASDNIIDLSQNNNQAGDSYTYQELLQELERLRSQELSREFLQGLHDASYEKVVLALLLGAGVGDMPAKIEYCSNSKFETVTFSNCLENTLRYIINVLLYNQETEQFDFEMLKINSPELSINQFDLKFKNFFEKTFGSDHYQYNALSARDANKQEVHDAWNQVVCNRDWCCYGKLIDHDGRVYEVEPRLSARGFLKLSLEDYQNLEQLFPGSIREAYSVNNVVVDGIYKIVFHNTGHTYLVFDPEKFKAFDIAPSIRNIIIMLDQLLGLGVVGDFKAAFDTKDFNTQFWPLLCQKLNVTCEDQVKGSLDNIDAWDFTAKCIHLRVSLNASMSGKKKISFFCQGESARYLAHSDYDSVKADNVILNGLQQKIFDQYLCDGWNDSSVLSLTSALLINTRMSLSQLFEKPIAFYGLKHLPIQYSSGRLRVIKSILIYQKAPHVSLQRYVRDLIRTTEPVTDLVPQQEILNCLRDSEWTKAQDLNFYSDRDMLFTLAIFGLDVWRPGEQGSLSFVAKKAIQKLFGKEVTGVIFDNSKKKLDSNLIFTKVDFNIILGMTEKYVSLQDYHFRSNHKKLIDFLFQELGSFEPTLQGNKQKIADDKRVLERIIKCIKEAACSRNDDIIRNGAGILEIFIKNNQSTLQVLNIVTELAKKGFFGCKYALKLFEQLILFHGLGQEEALLCAQRFITTFRSFDMTEAMVLLNALIDRDFGLEKIAFIAHKAVQDNAHSTQRRLGVELLIKLMSKNCGIKQAIDAYFILMGWYNRGLYAEEKNLLRSKFWPSIFNCIGMQNDETLNREYFEIFYAKFKEFYQKNKQIPLVQEPLAQEPLNMIIADMKKSQSTYVQKKMKQPEQGNWCIIS